MSSASSPRLMALGVFAASAIALGTAFIAQYIFGLEPCELCLIQRIPYAMTALLGLFGLVLPAEGVALVHLMRAAALLFLIGAVVAIHHVGVEQHWWAAVTSCSGGVPAGLSLDQLDAALDTKAPAQCDQPAWSLFGITMAGYNAIASLALAIVAWIGSRRLAQARSAS